MNYIYEFMIFIMLYDLGFLEEYKHSRPDQCCPCTKWTKKDCVAGGLHSLHLFVRFSLTIKFTTYKFINFRTIDSFITFFNSQYDTSTDITITSKSHVSLSLHKLNLNLKIVIYSCHFRRSHFATTTGSTASCFWIA